VDIEDDLPGSGLECGDFVERELVDAECGDAPGLHGFIRETTSDKGKRRQRIANCPVAVCLYL
jgi:hypothetical protein